MARLNIERQKKLEPSRVDYARDELQKLGFEVEVVTNNKEIRFDYKGSQIRLFPYSGWFTGRTIEDGRGLRKLLKQLI